MLISRDVDFCEVNIPVCKGLNEGSVKIERELDIDDRILFVCKTSVCCLFDSNLLSELLSGDGNGDFVKSIGILRHGNLVGLGWSPDGDNENVFEVWKGELIKGFVTNFVWGKPATGLSIDSRLQSLFDTSEFDENRWFSDLNVTNLVFLASLLKLPKLKSISKPGTVKELESISKLGKCDDAPTLEFERKDKLSDAELRFSADVKWPGWALLDKNNFVVGISIDS